MKLGLKGGFQLIQILGLLGMYFDAVVVEVKTFLLLFRLALAILCSQMELLNFENWSSGELSKIGHHFRK